VRPAPEALEKIKAAMAAGEQGEDLGEVVERLKAGGDF
jgi:hypothetical protein